MSSCTNVEVYEEPMTECPWRLDGRTKFYFKYDKYVFYIIRAFKFSKNPLLYFVIFGRMRKASVILYIGIIEKILFVCEC